MDPTNPSTDEFLRLGTKLGHPFLHVSKRIIALKAELKAGPTDREFIKSTALEIKLLLPSLYEAEEQAIASRDEALARNNEAERVQEFVNPMIAQVVASLTPIEEGEEGEEGEKQQQQQPKGSGGTVKLLDDYSAEAEKMQQKTYKVYWEAQQRVFDIDQYLRIYIKQELDDLTLGRKKSVLGTVGVTVVESVVNVAVGYMMYRLMFRALKDVM